MGENFAWFYDLLTLVIIGICIFTCYRKGLVRTVVMLGGFILAIFLGYVVAVNYSDNVYDKFVKSKAEDYVGESVDEFNINSEIKDIFKKQGYNIELSDDDVKTIVNSDKTISKGVVRFVKGKSIPLTDKQEKQLSDSFKSENILKELKSSLNPKAYKMIKSFNAISDNGLDKLCRSYANAASGKAAEDICNVVVRPLAINVIKLILFILVYMIVRVAVGLVGKLLKCVNSIPIAGTANKLFGGIVGFVQGTVTVFLIALIMKVIISISSAEMLFINTETINKTHIFRIFYNNHLFK